MSDAETIKRQIATVRRIAFAKAWLGNGFNKKAAAIEAGFPESTAKKMGQLLFKTEEVQLELARAREHLTKKTNVTIDTIGYELEEAAQLAKDCRNPSALVAAIGKKMILHGLEAEKGVNLKFKDETPQPQANRSALDDMLIQLEESKNASVH
jgi:hypothetical protein